MTTAAVRLLAGKTAAITGGTTGISRAITIDYLRQGANVAVNHPGLSRDEKWRTSLLEEAKKLRQEAPSNAPTGEILEISGDVTDPQTSKTLVAEAAKKWGALDILIANAGNFKSLQLSREIKSQCHLESLLTLSTASTKKYLIHLYMSMSTAPSTRAKPRQNKWSPKARAVPSSPYPLSAPSSAVANKSTTHPPRLLSSP